MFTSVCIVQYIMCNFHQIIAKSARRQEKMQFEETNQESESKSDITQILELSDNVMICLIII